MTAEEYLKSMNTKIDYAKLLDLFVDKNTSPINQTNFTKPVKQDGFIYATERHVLIRIPKTMCPLDFNEIFTPVMNSIFPTELNNLISFDINNLESQLTTPLIDEYVETESTCPDCDGEGEVECGECGHIKECDNIKCNDGKIIIKVKTGKLVPDTNTFFKIKHVVFSYSNLKILIDACKIIGENEVTYHINLLNKGQIFKVREIEILIMPVIFTEGEIYTEIKL